MSKDTEMLLILGGVAVVAYLIFSKTTTPVATPKVATTPTTSSGLIPSTVPGAAGYNADLTAATNLANEYL
jgi:hypothetical protein